MESIWIVRHTDDWSLAGETVGIMPTEMGAMHYCHWRAHMKSRRSGDEEIEFGQVERDRVVQGQNPTSPSATKQLCNYVSAGDNCWFIHEIDVLPVPSLSV